MTDEALKEKARALRKALEQIPACNTAALSFGQHTLRRHLDRSLFDRIEAECLAALASVRAEADAAATERAAKIAEAETLTGVPPIDWPLDKIEACEATVRATSQSIARAIREAAKSCP